MVDIESKKELEKEIRKMFGFSHEDYELLDDVCKDLLLLNYMRIQEKREKESVINSLKRIRKERLSLNNETVSKIVEREYQKRKMIKNNYQK